MPIRHEQPGASIAAATTGVAVGESQKEKEDRARAEREQARADAAAMQKQARQDEIKFALQKRQIDWQRSLAKEQRGEDRAMAAGDLQHQRAVERIELSKDLEHQYKEQERMRKLSAIDADEAALDKEIESGNSSEDELAIKIARMKIDNRRSALETGLPLERITNADKLALMMSDSGDAGVQPTATGPITIQQMEAAASIGKAILIRKSNGERVHVPIENVRAALSEGRFEVANVPGVSETTESLISRIYGAAIERPVEILSQTLPAVGSAAKKAALYKPFADRQAGTARFDFAGR